MNPSYNNLGAACGTAATLTWQAAGSPLHPCAEEPCRTACATCGMPITSGVSLTQIETPTTSNHADIFRFGSPYVCAACAWLFNAGTGRPGNYIATPHGIEYTVISVESVVTDKRPWLRVLSDIATLPGDTPVAGVMTTDVKPRLWPRVRLATIARFGLYVHAPDYDVSEYREFSLGACLTLIQVMLPPLRAGFAKASLYFGLGRDYARTARDPTRAVMWETTLAAERNQPHFVPALIAAGVRKEDKTDERITVRAARNTERATTRRNRADPAQPRLF